jgi:hypothetical protein
MTGGQEYYDGLITQGYTPDQALQYTQQHFPEFTATAPAVAPLDAFEVDQGKVDEIAATHGVDAGALADTARHFDANQDFILQPSELETTAQAMTNTVQPPAPMAAPAVAAPAVAAPAMAAPMAAPAMAAPMAAPAMAAPMGGMQQMGAPGMAAPMGGMPMAAPMGGMPQMGAPGMTTAISMPGNNKNVLVSYLLWFFLGIFGAHHLYMGRGIGIWIVSLITLQGLGFWWLIDAFMIPGSTNMHRGGPIVVVA